MKRPHPSQLYKHTVSEWVEDETRHITHSPHLALKGRLGGVRLTPLLESPGVQERGAVVECSWLKGLVGGAQDKAA